MNKIPGCGVERGHMWGRDINIYPEAVTKFGSISAGNYWAAMFTIENQVSLHVFLEMSSLSWKIFNSL